MGCGAFAARREVEVLKDEEVEIIEPLDEEKAAQLASLRAKLIRFSTTDAVRQMDGDTDMQRLFHFADYNGDGSIQFVEFLRMCGSTGKEYQLTHDECNALFWHLDKDASEGIDPEELIYWLEHGVPMPPEGEEPATPPLGPKHGDAPAPPPLPDAGPAPLTSEPTATSTTLPPTLPGTAPRRPSVDNGNEHALAMKMQAARLSRRRGSGGSVHAVGGDRRPSVQSNASHGAQARRPSPARQVRSGTTRTPSPNPMGDQVRPFRSPEGSLSPTRSSQRQRRPSAGSITAADARRAANMSQSLSPSRRLSEGSRPRRPSASGKLPPRGATVEWG
eukprot:TRINITY_DN18175_c0_g1_i1.p1 TRINITY_DN18175_c0_g1~~TRINITY_DN18175_c0_g1_i1.p1  ORF type:complete len:349 (+),score=62.48 TRINITY_DN18175_c0_g1_i1:50-1048(+)